MKLFLLPFLCIVAELMVAAPAQAESRSLPVPTMTLYPGDAVSPELTEARVFTANAAVWANYVVDIGQLGGKYAKRTLVAGQPIAISAIKDRDAVKRGVAASAVLQAEGLTITTILIPLESGTAGETIQARNPDSGNVITALVQADGSLAVGAQ